MENVCDLIYKLYGISLEKSTPSKLKYGVCHHCRAKKYTVNASGTVGQCYKCKTKNYLKDLKLEVSDEAVEVQIPQINEPVQEEKVIEESRPKYKEVNGKHFVLVNGNYMRHYPKTQSSEGVN